MYLLWQVSNISTDHLRIINPTVTSSALVLASSAIILKVFSLHKCYRRKQKILENKILENKILENLLKEFLSLHHKSVTNTVGSSSGISKWRWVL